MNEMRLSTGFMNDVTSLFVPKLCLDNHNKVAVAVEKVCGGCQIYQKNILRDVDFS